MLKGINVYTYIYIYLYHVYEVYFMPDLLSIYSYST